MPHSPHKNTRNVDAVQPDRIALPRPAMRLLPSPHADVSARMKRRLKYARRIVEGRRGRLHFFPSQVFSDPAWDLLLDLYVGHCEARATTLADLARGVPLSEDSARRWIALLAEEGHVCRQSAGGEVMLSLSESARESFDSYFDWLALGPLDAAPLFGPRGASA